MTQPHVLPDKRKNVFVVHGRNLAARQAMFSFLRSVELHPIEWSRARALTEQASPYVGEILDAAFGAAQAVVVLFTPDEVVRLRPEYADSITDIELSLDTQARPNVLFEAGMAMGRNADRTVLVELGRMRGFTDVFGRHSLRISNSADRRIDLVERLKTAGCTPELSGSDWLESGDFTPPADIERGRFRGDDNGGSTPESEDRTDAGSIVRRREIRKTKKDK